MEEGPLLRWPLDKPQKRGRSIAESFLHFIIKDQLFPSYRDNLADGSPIGEVSENGKDDDSGKDGGQRIAQAHNKSVPEC